MKNKEYQDRYTELDKETAYIYYFQLGEKRTLNKVKKKTGIPLVILTDWAKRFKWNEKVKEQEGFVKDSKDSKKSATLAELSSASVFGLYLGIINSPKATNADKLRAAEKLEKLSDKAAALKDFRKVAIKITGLDELKDKMREAGLPVREDIEEETD